MAITRCLGPVGLCAVQAALATGAAPVYAIDGVEQRLEVARALGATPVHLTEERPRDLVRSATEGRGLPQHSGPGLLYGG